MPIANFFTEGMTMTHSASLSRSVGRLSGISRISFITSPHCSRRSTSFLLVAAAADKQPSAATHSMPTTLFNRTRPTPPAASVIIMLPDDDSRPNKRDRYMDAVRERIQNVIQIIAMEVDVFRALWPKDGDFCAVVGDEEDIDVLRVALSIVMLAMVFVFIVVVVIVVVVTAAFDKNRIGLDDFVSRLIARHRRRGRLQSS